MTFLSCVFFYLQWKKNKKVLTSPIMYHLKLIVVNYMLSFNLSLTVPDDNTEILFVLSTEHGVHDCKSLPKIFKFLNKTLKGKPLEN